MSLLSKRVRIRPLEHMTFETFPKTGEIAKKGQTTVGYFVQSKWPNKLICSAPLDMGSHIYIRHREELVDSWVIVKIKKCPEGKWGPRRAIANGQIHGEQYRILELFVHKGIHPHSFPKLINPQPKRTKKEVKKEKAAEQSIASLLRSYWQQRTHHAPSAHIPKLGKFYPIIETFGEDYFFTEEPILIQVTKGRTTDISHDGFHLCKVNLMHKDVKVSVNACIPEDLHPLET